MTGLGRAFAQADGRERFTARASEPKLPKFLCFAAPRLLAGWVKFLLNFAWLPLGRSNFGFGTGMLKA